MEWILNDLSLESRYTNTADFLDDIESFLKCRSENVGINNNFYCPRGIGNVEVVKGKKFSQIIMQDAPRNLRQPIMSWVSKKGPFWCDNRTFNEDDYFEHCSIDVTDMGLGECARKAILEQRVSSYSFSGLFDNTPLVVQHGLPEEVLGVYDVPNFWTLAQLVESSQRAIPKPTKWDEAIEQLNGKYTNLIFSPCLLDQISTLPFNMTVFDRMQELCRVLEEYLTSRDESGNLTAKSHEIERLHFHGDKAWFSDESDEDKRAFEQKLKFTDSRDGVKKTYTFHGKIKTPQVRVYFEWPIKPSQNDIQIVYFGPKITKK